ncbi:hypothetical protein ACFLRA_03440 [Bdellovibrionota bacterium]
MIKFSGDITRFIECLWSEERVNQILSQEWDDLNRLRQLYNGEVEEAILMLNGLRQLNDCRKYVSTLSETVRDLLLLDLARDLKALGDDSTTMQ